MQKAVCSTAIVLTLLSGVGVAAAADLTLTSAQKQTIFQSVMNEKGQALPAGFQAKVGTAVPPSLSLHSLPASIATQVPAAKEYEYAKMQNNEVLLINPKDRHIAEIIMQTSTTGSAK